MQILGWLLALFIGISLWQFTRPYGADYARRSAILDLQRHEAREMKRIVDTMQAQGHFPAWKSAKVIGSEYFRFVPSAQTNPFTGRSRVWLDSGEGAYFACSVETHGQEIQLYSPLQSPCGPGGSIRQAKPGDSKNILGGFLFIYDNINADGRFRVHFADGTEHSSARWAFVETNMNGEIYAAAGGDRAIK